MNEIKAFVGHSFTPGDSDIFRPTDKEVVSAFLGILAEITKLQPRFSWEHAERAQTIGIDDKVLSISADKNVFIGICTKKKQVLPLSPTGPKKWWAPGKSAQPVWKTSDWIIQEIGLAIGRNCRIILLVESGVRPPGGLQGALEYIEFERAAPEKAVEKLLQMITSIVPVNAPSVAVVAQSDSDTEQSQPQPPPNFDWKTPKPDWGIIDYQFAFRLSVMTDDEQTASALAETYLQTENAKEELKRIEWAAYCELQRIEFGKGGNLQKLKEMAVACPESAAVFRYLAKAFEAFDNYAEAARNFQIAAEKTTDSTLQVRMLGRAAVALAYAKVAKNIVTKSVDEVRSRADSAGVDEREVLYALKELAEIDKDTQLEIAIMQRMVELNPADLRMRFSLAYKHSESGNDDLALYHYQKIPPHQRDSTTWNNLGVALDSAKLPSKAVEAFQKAQSEGDTLAMSNIANKFLSAGFLVEARLLIGEAMKKPKVHSNIPRTMAKLQDQEEREGVVLESKIEGTIGKNAFYSQVGASIAKKVIRELAGKWIGVECTLDVTVEESVFHAKGQYETTANAMMGLGGIFNLGGVRPSPESWKIEYVGTLYGRAFQGQVYRERVGETTSMLTRLEKAAKVLMTLSDDEREFEVMEQFKDQTPIYYKIARYSEPSPQFVEAQGS